MRKLSLWMRRHPVVGDTTIALFLGAFDMLALTSPMGGTTTWIFIVIGGGLILPLVIRRRYPVLSAYLVLIAGVAQLLTHGDAGPTVTDARMRLADIALGISLYTLVAYVGRRAGLLYAGWLALGTGVWAAWRLEEKEWFFGVVVVVVIFAFCWALGEFIGARRAYQNEVEQRVKLLETERDQQAKIAVAEERTRIARELHDVVAHAVSVIIVQADGAAYAVRKNPDVAERAVKTIASTGREALTELRRLLGVLRNDDGDGGEERAPQPGTESLSELAEKVRKIGLPVRLEAAGKLDDLPAGVSLGVYRIVQESLTNTLKHAGPGASATVKVTRDDERVLLEITDNGTGRIAEHTPAAVPGGNGLIGMRERANVFGGTLSAGPRAQGGWRVTAVLPVQDA
ncbi:sensor histidine kinase [Herbihabitans rhizosphaerae]|uniref:sensor histidine kinase n=1 Tax=Herbihabitans rhizosphaerae TaxID=1872711 RepID=UPI003BF826CA